MTTAISFPPALDETTLQELDDLLAALRETHEEVPQWEFCDGFLTAVACTRRPIGVHEWLPMLLGDGEPLPAHAPLPQLPVFGTEAQQTRFLELAQARLDEILRQLDRPTHSLEEDDAFSPEVLDTRGAVLMMSAEEQAEIGDEPIPSLAQVWALGFMFAVENWEADWALPRDKEAAQMIDNALEQIVALTEDDTGKPAHNLYDENGPASTSQPRIDAFGHAIWGIYDLRQAWRSLGPQQETIVKGVQPGRNDPCSCGGGKKYKKCCGA
ncbi:MAG: UPF0149 family protein [Comamonas sp.]|nr:UPF0149 family protein [Comamonas sp.]